MILGCNDKNLLNVKNKSYKLDEININDKDSSIAIIAGQIVENSTVLDVGCSYGYLGEWLTKFKKCQVYGIDNNSDAVQYVKNKKVYKDVLLIDLDDFSSKINQDILLSDFKIDFDYVVFGDILEHLKDPASCLYKVCEKLKYNSKVLVSVPNIANIDIILNLIDGKFNYSEYGILDNTHLRFFTKRSFVEWIYFSNNLSKNYKFDIKYICSTNLETEYINKLRTKYYNEFSSLFNHDEFFELQNIFMLTKIRNNCQNRHINKLLEENNESKVEKIFDYIRKINNDILNQKKIMTENEIRINNLIKENEDKAAEINLINSKLQECKKRLIQIYESNGWKLLLKYYKLRNKFF